MTPNDRRIKADKKLKEERKKTGKVDEGGWESSLGLVSADHCGDPVRTLALVFVLALVP